MRQRIQHKWHTEQNACVDTTQKNEAGTDSAEVVEIRYGWAGKATCGEPADATMPRRLYYPPGQSPS